MGKKENGVFWAARDLSDFWKFVGNHHFILIAFENEEDGKRLCDEFGWKPPVKEGDFCFCTLGGFLKNKKLVFEQNEKDDVLSVKEWLKPESITGWYDLDLEKHKIKGREDKKLISTVMKLAYNYSTGPGTEYDLSDSNCASWVNTLFAVAGISKKDRIEAGEFDGIDWGEEDMIPEKLFGKA